MQTIAETIPEYKVRRSMAGIGDRLGPIILAKIGDIRRFHSDKALNSFAGNDAPPYQSGQFESRNRHIHLKQQRQFIKHTNDCSVNLIT